ncbi:DUF6265 family protein [Hyphococcus sp.]|uniref:DUF6265 family protein n=1 Tax=Hyphococcus sp. TaxID=2038636 RepID=UPI003CCC2A1F
MRIFLTLIAAALMFGPLAQAAETNVDANVEIKTLGDGQSSPPAQIGDLSWLIGHWKGAGLGGKSEEIVSPPLDGQMMGMFRQTKPDGTLMFYEFYLFAEIDDTLVLKIKHFNPDLKGWEEKDDYVSFPLVAAEENAVYFDGLTFKMTGPDELRAAVIVDGQGRLEFAYRKTD